MTETNWASEFARAFKSPLELYQFLDWELPSHVEKVSATFSTLIPRRLAQKIKEQGPSGVLAREFLPHDLELDPELNVLGLEDPIGDQAHLQAPQLIHRYPSRVLFTPSNICPVHCRYCFRRNELNPNQELFQQDFNLTLEYLKAHPEVTEVIFTGGDPFTLSNDKIKKYLNAFSEISSIKDIRFHSRYPVILPERIDTGLLSVLTHAARHFRTVSIAIHANHLSEFDPLTNFTIEALAQLPVQLLSQTVLLKGVNDSPQALEDLINHFIKLKIRPYYLHHPDRVKGGMHFYIPLEEGRKIYSRLRRNLPGWAIPHYVIDVPGGHGKVPAFNPESHTYSGILLTGMGEKVQMPEPESP